MSVKSLAVILLAISIGVAASAQTTIPQVTAIGPTDLFQDLPQGNSSYGNYYANAQLLGNYGATQPGNNPDNALIGGDATSNLFQRGTTGASVTTAVTYGGPDRWAYWSGASTAMTVSRDSTAADLAPNYQYAFKMARTSGQTGVVQMCMMQEVLSLNSYQFAGQTAEVDFHAVTGANFSAASNNVVVYFISGTGQNEGTVNAAFGLNAGGGGASAWTGQVSTGVTVPLSNATLGGRYSAAAPIPSGATEVAVAICYTPTGTAGTNDYVALSGIQMVRNSALASVAGSAGAALNVNDTRAKAFARRPASLEALLQYPYHYRVTETNGVYIGMGICSAANVQRIGFPIPVPFRATPTLTASTATGGFKWNLAGTETAAGTFTLVSGSTASNVTLGDTTTCTSGTIAALNGSATTGIIDLDAEL